MIEPALPLASHAVLPPPPQTDSAPPASDSLPPEGANSRVPTMAPGRPLTVVASAALKLRDAAERLGLDRATLARESGFDFTAAEERDARVPFTTILELWSTVLRHVDDPSLPLLTAQSYSPSDYELLGFVAMTSDSLRAALPAAQRFMRLFNEAAACQVHEGVAGDLEIELLLTGEASQALRCSTESGIAELVHFARVGTGRPIRPRVVRFAHPAPSSTAAHQEFFGCPIVWGCGTTRLILAREDLQAPMLRADASLAGFLLGEAEKRMAQLPPAGELGDRVRSHIAALLARGEPTMEVVAERLDITVRTLRRQLEKANLSFRHLVDEVRRASAMAMIEDPRLTITEVALLLGFSEPSPFHRAFKRWTGTTPAEHRRRVLEGPAGASS